MHPRHHQEVAQMHDQCTTPEHHKPSPDTRAPRTGPSAPASPPAAPVRNDATSAGPAPSHRPGDPAPQHPHPCPTCGRDSFCLLSSAALDWVLIAKEALDNAQAALEREGQP